MTVTIEKLKKQVKELVEESSYYQQKYANFHIEGFKNLADFSSLPLLTPDELIDHAEDIVPKNRHPYRLTSSSGTLGNPKVIYRTKEDTQVSEDILVRLLSMAKVNKGDTILIGQPFDMAHFGYLVFGAATKIGAISIPVGISITNESLMSTIEHFKPNVICTSLSRLLTIMDMFKEKNINNLPFVKTVILAGEPVSNKGIEAIEKYFGFLPFNFYGSEETDGLAGDCENHNGLHFFDDKFYLELLPIEGIQSTDPLKKIGEAVITSLYQSGTPLIRYRLGDIIEISEQPCACGNQYPTIKTLGRVNDSFTIFDGITILGYQIEKVLRSEVLDMTNYQIVLSTIVPGLEEIKVKIATNEEIFDTATKEHSIQEKIWYSSEDLSAAKAAGALRIRVEINSGHIHVTQRGKTPKIVDLRTA